MTARQLRQLPRAARVRAIWDELTPTGREQAWGALDEDRRLECIGVLFDATEIAPTVTPLQVRDTPSAAFDRWQRRAER